MRLGPHEISVAEMDPAAASRRAVLNAHWAHSAAESPSESCHSLGLDDLRRDDVTFWAALRDGDAVGMVALRALDRRRGQVKSMHVLASQRGMGVADLLMETLLSVARRRGYRQLFLETGASESYVPAVKVYQRFGFAECPPFGDYAIDPYSLYMARAL